MHFIKQRLKGLHYFSLRASLYVVTSRIIVRSLRNFGFHAATQEQRSCKHARQHDRPAYMLFQARVPPASKVKRHPAAEIGFSVGFRESPASPRKPPLLQRPTAPRRLHRRAEGRVGMHLNMRMCTNFLLTSVAARPQPVSAALPVNWCGAPAAGAHVGIADSTDDIPETPGRLAGAIPAPRVRVMPAGTPGRLVSTFSQRTWLGRARWRGRPRGG